MRPRLRCLIETPAGAASGKATVDRFGFEELTTRDWTEVLGSTECDLFLNAGPNKAHVEPSIGFARAGKHVFSPRLNPAQARWAILALTTST